jgi:hypothetical protein
MIDSLKTPLEKIPIPDNDLQYIVYAIAFTIIVIILGTKYIDAKFGKKVEEESSAEIAKAVSALITPSIEALQKRMDSMEVQNAESFRWIHGRLNDHLKLHGFSKQAVEEWDGEERRGGNR